MQVICAFSLLFLLASQVIIFEKRQLHLTSSYVDRIETLRDQQKKPLASYSDLIETPRSQKSLDASKIPHRSIEEGWGGRSSMLLEFAFRFSPVAGFPLFLLFLMSILSGLFIVAFPKVLSQGWGGLGLGGNRSILAGIWLLPVLFGFILQNIVNMHAQIPYFTTNLLTVIFLFRYQLDLHDD